jgi:hypothetical protein
MEEIFGYAQQATTALVKWLAGARARYDNRRGGPRMRTSEAFILGTITSAVVIWFWGRQIEGFVQGKTREVRAKAAEGILAVETQTGKVLDRGGRSLRRAEEFLQDTKEHVSDALRAGEVAIRPAAKTGEAR